MRIFTLILPIFYFSYWLIYKIKPFSLIWFILIYLVLFLFEMIITAIIKGSSKVIKDKSLNIDEKISGFDKRLNLLEKRLK
jgi:hypothetical protein